MYCDKCDKEFTKRTVFNNKTIEEYKNIYGTRCPYCHFLIKPDGEHSVGLENIEKQEKLKQEMLKKMKNKFNKKG